MFQDGLMEAICASIFTPQVRRSRYFTAAARTYAKKGVHVRQPRAWGRPPSVGFSCLDPGQGCTQHRSRRSDQRHMLSPPTRIDADQQGGMVQATTARSRPWDPSPYDMLQSLVLLTISSPFSLSFQSSFHLSFTVLVRYRSLANI